MPLFNIKKLLDQADILSEMQRLSKEALTATEGKENTQVTVMLNASDNVYVYLFDDALSADRAGEDALIELMRANEDTEVKYLLCSWYSGGLDLPSYDLRKKLYHLNLRNFDTKIFVKTGEGVLPRPLGTTIKI